MSSTTLPSAPLYTKDTHDSIKAGQSPLTSAGTEHGAGMDVSGDTPQEAGFKLLIKQGD